MFLSFGQLLDFAPLASSRAPTATTTNRRISPPLAAAAAVAIYLTSATPAWFPAQATWHAVTTSCHPCRVSKAQLSALCNTL